jgi:hypothetical protein
MVKKNFFCLLMPDGRFRIYEDQKSTNPTADPEHCVIQNLFVLSGVSPSIIKLKSTFL